MTTREKVWRLNNFFMMGGSIEWGKKAINGEITETWHMYCVHIDFCRDCPLLLHQPGPGFDKERDYFCNMIEKWPTTLDEETIDILSLMGYNLEKNQ